MRHKKSFNHLSRTSAHRKSMMANMASSLIEHKRITTTVAKAKALRTFVEPLITRSKEDSTHSRRMVFKQLRSKNAVSELFREVAPKVADRPGGYTRIIKTGFRSGDAAEMCLVELVDYNEMYNPNEKAGGKKKRRRRRGGKKKSDETQNQQDTQAETTSTEEATTSADEGSKPEAKADTQNTESKKESGDTSAEKKQESKAEAKTDQPEAKKSDKPSSSAGKDEAESDEKKAESKKESKPKSEKSDDKDDKDKSGE